MKKQVPHLPPSREAPQETARSPAGGPPGHWRASGRVVLVYVVVLAGVTLPTPLYPSFEARWTLTNVEVAALYALYPVGVLAVLLVAGHWADQVGRRTIATAAVMCSGLSSCALLVADSPWTVAVGRLLTGLASGFMVNAANALLVELAPPGGRRRASVLSTGVNQVGLGLGAIVSAVLVQYAWAPTRLVFGCHIAALLLALATLRRVPETVPDRRRPTLHLQALGLPAHCRVAFLAASLAAFAVFALCGLLAALAPAIVADELHTTNALYPGGAVALVFIASGVSQALWVRADDVPALVVGTALLLAGLGALTTGLALGSAAIFLIGVAVGGAAVGAVYMSSLALVNRAVPDEDRARLVGTYLFVTFAGLIVPVIGTGLLADRLTQLQATVVFSSVVGLVAVLSAGLVATSARRATASGRSCA